jgi:DEAD/DEAH box helicase domain-containing protein
MKKRRALPRVLEDLEAARFFSPCLTAKVSLPARPGEFSEAPEELADSLKSALRDRGITQLYSHQAEAFRRARAGEDFIVVTPTASGKTLCYNLPVLNAIEADPKTRALYLFPTKALAQDQLAELEGLVRASKATVRAYTYDGDTPADIRVAIRKKAQIVISNPDMLHAGILPHHTKWNEFFRNLSFVVIDETHTYRGVFGSHMVNVMRRLQRVCRHYGSRPQFIFCSATIANPKEVAERLIAGEVVLIDRNGAPQGEKRFYFVNPPVIQKELGLRKSPLTMVQQIAGEFLQSGVSTIVFTTTRLNVEVLTKYLKDLFRKSGLEEDRKIRGYRGGYLPNLRREIEKGLREGKIKGVVSTNALELGVDIGSLEACILCGYPGSIASTWQQAGRAGRRAGLSCAVLVSRSTPLDQFIVHHPDYFFGRSPENARLNPENLSILLSHIQCGAFELPFQKGEAFGEAGLEEILDFLAEKRVLKKLGDSWYWAEDSYPADRISLRSVAAENFVVVDKSEGNQILAEVDFESAPLTVYPGAIYMVESQQYQVERLDYDNRKAYVTPVKAEYYTEAVLYTHLKILDVFLSDPEEGKKRGPHFHEGEVHVSNHVAGFKKLKFYSMENLGYGEVSLPDQEMHTTAFWITVPPEDALEIGLAIQELLEALAGAGYAMQHMASFLLMCETRDLGKCIGDPYFQWFFSAEKDKVRFEPPPVNETGAPPGEGGVRDQGFQPTLFLYDAYPGGVGLSSCLFTQRDALLRGTVSVIERCTCTHGCPSCVGPPGALGERAKQDAVRLLKWMISGIG